MSAIGFLYSNFPGTAVPAGEVVVEAPCGVPPPAHTEGPGIAIFQRESRIHRRIIDMRTDTVGGTVIVEPARIRSLLVFPGVGGRSAVIGSQMIAEKRIIQDAGDLPSPQAFAV